MSSPPSLDYLIQGIKLLSLSATPDKHDKIEAYLEWELREVALAERLNLVENLARKISRQEPVARPDLKLESAETARLLALLLGEGLAASESSCSDMSEKLTDSLNTVFDSLNQIIFVIQSTLLGGKPEIETIRHVIGSQIGGRGEDASLKMYLDQIQHAFLTAHRSFQEASRSIVAEMLSALDPETLEKETNSGLKFGPLRKAQLFDSYVEKYQGCKKWFDSGHFSEKLLREFEKTCQKSYQERK